LYWWYPLVWWGRRQIQVHEEECCDAWVVSELSPRAYASAIVETLDFLAETRPGLPVLASGLNRIHNLKQRLTQIMKQNTPKHLSRFGWLTVFAAALLLPVLPTLARPEKKADNSGPARLAGPTDAAPADEVPALAEDDRLTFEPTPRNLLG